MIEKSKALVIDVDGVISRKKAPEQSYDDVLPNTEVIKKIKDYRSMGFRIILYSSRNMNTFDGNMGRINAVTLKGLLSWLDKHNIPYDEVHMGKPWCGRLGFYVDDLCIRPSEFLEKSYSEITALLKKESLAIERHRPGDDVRLHGPDTEEKDPGASKST